MISDDIRKYADVLISDFKKYSGVKSSKGNYYTGLQVQFTTKNGSQKVEFIITLEDGSVKKFTKKVPVITIDILDALYFQSFFFAKDAI